MSASSARFVAFAGRQRPADPVARADFVTSVADLRAAVCLEAGVDPADIGSLGFDYSNAAYARVRRSWVGHIGQFGLTLFDSGLEQAFAIWQGIRPDLTAGDDWRAAGAEAHKERYVDGCGREACVVCFPLPEEYM